MAALRDWYVHVLVDTNHLGGHKTTITLTQTTDSMEGAIKLSREELQQRFRLIPGLYEFIECGIKDGQ